MSKIRQASEPVLRSVSIGFSSGFNWKSRESDWGQLIWASRGVITVNVGAALWVVPAHQMLWLPASLAHSVRMSGRGTLRRIYFKRSFCRSLPREPRVMRVGPLLRELFRRVLQLGTLSKENASQSRLLSMILDEMIVVPLAPVELPMPSDSRAVRAAEFVRASPADATDAELVARRANASVRTLERLFAAETGLSFGAWRQRARLLHAMALLAEGAPVTQVGLAVGYNSTSAFVSAFRRAAGVTPGKYVQAPANDSERV